MDNFLNQDIFHLRQNPRFIDPLNFVVIYQVVLSQHGKRTKYRLLYQSRCYPCPDFEAVGQVRCRRHRVKAGS